MAIDLEPPFLVDRRRGDPSPSASEINQQILDLLHERGSLSTTALAQTTREDIKQITGRLNALTRLGLLQLAKDDQGSTVYSLSTTGRRARGLAYLSIHRK